jgi:hypothetical protein
MIEQDVAALLDMLYPYFIKKYKESNEYKQTAKLVNGIITNNAIPIQVKINPYDTETITAIRSTGLLGKELLVGDNVMLIYNDSLKNAIIIHKN